MVVQGLLASGLRTREFANQNGLNVRTLEAWRREAARMEHPRSAPHATKKQPAVATSRSLFVPVTLRSESTPAMDSAKREGIELFVGGLRVQLPRDIEPSVLAAHVAALSEVANPC